jgi:hypothetical protein
MSITDLTSIKRALMSDLKKEDEKPYDEYRQGVGAGLTMALMRIERMLEEEERDLSQYYGEDRE